MGNGRANPTDVPLFLNTPFTFYNEQGNPIQMQGSEGLDAIE